MRAAMLLVALAGPAAAQDACTDAWRALEAAGQAGFVPLVEADAVALADDGWCEARGLRMPAGGPPSPELRADVLRWRGEGIEAAVAGGPPPRAVEAEVVGARLAPRTGDAGLDWAFDAQARREGGVAGSLSLAWDEDARALRLDRLRLDFPGENGIEAAAAAEAVDLSSWAAARTSLGSAALTQAQVVVESNGLFEAYALLPLAGTLLGGSSDPEKEAEALKAEAIRQVGAWPAAIFPDPTRAELQAALASLPNPSGTLTLDLLAEPGIGLGRFARFAITGAPRSAAELWPALDGVTLRADWAPAPQVAPQVAP